MLNHPDNLGGAHVAEPREIVPGDLRLLSKLEGFELPENCTDVRGWTAYDTEGNEAGRVVDLVANPSTSDVPMAVVESPGSLMQRVMGGRRVAVPLENAQVDAAQQRVGLQFTREQLESAPDFEEDGPRWPEYFGYWQTSNLMRPPFFQAPTVMPNLITARQQEYNTTAGAVDSGVGVGLTDHDVEEETRLHADGHEPRP